ncbi:MAG: tryptophan 7-halogenase [Alphaproteobacteria bacterium]|nr:tryptophan 7-halogenase [Alphaproteobacteria bacterium]MBO6863615.1 tryptophan 7-halogenase [Alphaproteobacteria bacterium]
MSDPISANLPAHTPLKAAGTAEPYRCSVLVVGGGPAGSTVSALLAARGIDVLLVEKDRHPRFHIGESLLPRNIPILRRLGLEDRLRSIGVLKRGADFSVPDGSRHIVFNFRDAMRPDEPTAFQVRRSEFDHMLIDNAEKAGVRVYQETRLDDLDIREDGVTAQVTGPDGTASVVEADWVVDATGRDSFLSRKLALKRRDPRHASAAVFGHFDGVERRPGDEAGNISIYWFDQGWFWVIPLRDGCTSVGMVCYPRYLKDRRGGLEDLFRETVARTPGLAQRMRHATARDGVQGTGNFSYRSTQMTGNRFFLVGDAYAFIDPVFSSGVYLAMQGAEYAAEAIEACLADPRSAARYQRRYERRVKRGLRVFSWFIYRFTSPAFRSLFTQPTDKFSLRAAVISVLSGDVYGRTPLWSRLMLFRAIYWFTSLVLWRRGGAYRGRLAEHEARFN